MNTPTVFSSIPQDKNLWKDLFPVRKPRVEKVVKRLSAFLAILLGIVGPIFLGTAYSYADAGMSISSVPGNTPGTVSVTITVNDGRTYYFGVANAVNAQKVLDGTITTPYGAGDYVDNLYTMSFTTSSTDHTTTTTMTTNSSGVYHDGGWGPLSDDILLWAAPFDGTIPQHTLVNRMTGVSPVTNPPTTPPVIPPSDSLVPVDGFFGILTGFTTNNLLPLFFVLVAITIGVMMLIRYGKKSVSS